MSFLLITTFTPIDRQKETISYIGDLSDDLSVEAKYTGITYKNDQDSLGGEKFWSSQDNSPKW